MLTTSPTLLNRLRQPSQPEAWARFVHLYSPLLLCWARRQGFQDADAQDLVQEVLVKLVRALPTYEWGEGQSFRGWLFRVSQNLWESHRRRQVNRALPGANGLSGVEDRPGSADPEEAADRLVLVRRVLELIRRDFSARTWAVFTAVRLDGRPVAEVAAEHGMKPGAVSCAVNRVMTRIRDELTRLLD